MLCTLRGGSKDARPDRILLTTPSASLSIPLTRASHYDGFVIFKEGTPIDPLKLIYAIVPDLGTIVRIDIRSPSSATVHHARGPITYSLVDAGGSCALHITTNASGYLDLDVRHPYDSDPFGKQYALEKDASGIRIIARRHETVHTIHLCTDASFEPVGEWVPVQTPYDAHRSDPREQYVYRLRYENMRTCTILLDAPPPAGIVHPEETPADMRRIIIDSLWGLFIHDRLIAGHPWFFHSWTRDAAISAAGARLARIPMKDLLFSLLGTGDRSNDHPGSLRSADGIPLVLLNLDKETLTEDERSRYLEHLLAYLHDLEPRIDDLVSNGGLETWMDSGEHTDDPFRQGYCLEIQAYIIRLYEIAHTLSGDDHYASRVRTLRTNCCAFYSTDTLDTAKEPLPLTNSIFLAAHYLPDLYAPQEWEHIFDIAIERLYSEGRFSSIDRTSERYRPHHTGVTNQSYHRGDSWYFINNLAAIVLSRCNKEKYAMIIQEILSESIEDIWRGAIGHCSEIIGMEDELPAGCWSQAWSAATLLELIEEVGFNE